MKICPNCEHLIEDNECVCLVCATEILIKEENL